MIKEIIKLSQRSLIRLKRKLLLLAKILHAACVSRDINGYCCLLAVVVLTNESLSVWEKNEKRITQTQFRSGKCSCSKLNAIAVMRGIKKLPELAFIVILTYVRSFASCAARAARPWGQFLESNTGVSTFWYACTHGPLTCRLITGRSGPTELSNSFLLHRLGNHFPSQTLHERYLAALASLTNRQSTSDESISLTSAVHDVWFKKGPKGW